MLLSDVSVRRPVFAMVISMVLVILGAQAFFDLAVREYPDIAPPIVSISTPYRGASADVVETKITQIIEDAVAGIEGIDKLTSSSRDEMSRVTIQFNLSRDVDEAANDVRDRVARVVGRLPIEADPPQIGKQDADAMSVLYINVASDRMNNLELTEYAERVLVDQFSVVNGVASVSISGARRYAMRIWLDRKALAARQLTVDDVERALRDENVELPAGRLESSQREFTVRTETGFVSEEDFRRLVIGRNQAGYLVRLDEVARVELAAEDTRSIARANGQSGVSLGITQQSQANTVETIRGVKREIARIEPTLPEGLELAINIDQSLFIEASFREVAKAISFALALVLIVIYLFLGNFRATLIPAVVIPISLISTFIVLNFLGFSLNTLTLLGLVLAIGLVVDDAIVVLENIYRRIEHGQPTLLASLDGSREIGFAVIATTLVLVAVFVPLSFIEGNIGRLFGEFGITVAVAVLFSSLIALTLVPMMSSKLFSRAQTKEGFTHTLDLFFQGLANRYRRSLAPIVSTPWYAVTAVLVVLGVAIMLFRTLPSEYAPPEDRGIVAVFMRAPEGASLDYSQRYASQIEAILAEEFDRGNLRRSLLRLPGSWGGGTGEVNSAMLFNLLEPWGARPDSAQTIARRIETKAAALPGVTVRVITPQGLAVGGGFSRPVQVVIGGGEYKQVAAWRTQLVDAMRENPGFVAPTSNYYERKPQIRVAVDRDRAADLGVSLSTVARTLETALGSRFVTTFLRNGNEYNVVVQMQESDRSAPSDLTNIYVRSQRGEVLVPLANLVRLAEVAGASELRRFDRLRAITVSAGLAPNYALGEALNWVNQFARQELPPNAVIKFDGESREYLESGSSLFITFGMALLLVFLVLAAQFESFRHPLIIMMTVPLAVTGALIGLKLLGFSINVFSQIGIVMLVGLSAKNGVLIVEFANQLRDKGKEFTEAIMEAAATRLRPVLMTSMCTAFGSIPLLMAAGAGAEGRKPLGAVIFFGVGFSTLLTLFVVPAVYSLLAKSTKSPDYVSRKIRELKALGAGG